MVANWDNDWLPDSQRLDRAKSRIYVLERALRRDEETFRTIVELMHGGMSLSAKIGAADFHSQDALYHLRRALKGEED